MKEKKEIFLSTIILKSKYGQKGMVAGDTSILGKNVVEKEFSSYKEEKFSESIKSVKTLIEKLEESSK